jgi:arginine repressor
MVKSIGFFKTRVGKQNRHEKVTKLLLSGNLVSPEEIYQKFKGTDQEAVIYRLSTNIYNIRRDGGIVKVHKNGRKVTAYQLINAERFDSNGRYQPTKTSSVSNNLEYQNTIKDISAGELTSVPAQ